MGGGRGIPFVVAAPSGTGKTTVCRALMESTDSIEFSVSHTTRPPRITERDGFDYLFVSAREFQDLVDSGGFLEHAEYNGYRYGTSASGVEGTLDRGRDVLLEIEIQGARQVRERRTDARLIFLLPPSLEHLKDRLRGRGTDSDDAIQKRLEIARGEVEAMAWFDYLVLNDQLASCVEAVRSIVLGERSGNLEGVKEAFGRARHLDGMRRRLKA